MDDPANDDKEVPRVLVAGSCGAYGASLADGSEYTGKYTCKSEWDGKVWNLLGPDGPFKTDEKTQQFFYMWHSTRAKHLCEVKWASEYEETEKEEDIATGKMVSNGKKTGRINPKTGKKWMEMGPVVRGIDCLAFETLPLKNEAIGCVQLMHDCELCGYISFTGRVEMQDVIEEIEVEVEEEVEVEGADDEIDAETGKTTKATKKVVKKVKEKRPTGEKVEKCVLGSGEDLAEALEALPKSPWLVGISVNCVAAAHTQKMVKVLRDYADKENARRREAIEEVKRICGFGTMPAEKNHMIFEDPEFYQNIYYNVHPEINDGEPYFVARHYEVMQYYGNELQVLAYPNSGERYDGETKAWVVDEAVGDKDYCVLADEWDAAGCNFIGGCCRVYPNEIEKVCQHMFQKQNTVEDLTIAAKMGVWQEIEAQVKAEEEAAKQADAGDGEGAAEEATEGMDLAAGADAYNGEFIA